MRIWVDPRKLAQNGLRAIDVIQCDQGAERQVAAGDDRLGRRSTGTSRIRTRSRPRRGARRPPNTSRTSDPAATPAEGSCASATSGTSNSGRKTTRPVPLQRKARDRFRHPALPTANGSASLQGRSKARSVSAAFPPGVHYQSGSTRRRSSPNRSPKSLMTLSSRSPWSSLVIYLSCRTGARR